MHTLQMFTFTFPWWGTLLILLFFAYLAIGTNINPDFFLPIYHVPVRVILPGAAIFLLLGFICPRIRFSVQNLGLSALGIGALPSGKEMALLIGGVGIVLSLITWGIYAIVRPREKRFKPEDRKDD